MVTAQARISFFIYKRNNRRIFTNNLIQMGYKKVSCITTSRHTNKPQHMSAVSDIPGNLCINNQILISERVYIDHTIVKIQRRRPASNHPICIWNLLPQHVRTITHLWNLLPHHVRNMTHLQMESITPSCEDHDPPVDGTYCPSM